MQKAKHEYDASTFVCGGRYCLCSTYSIEWVINKNWSSAVGASPVKSTVVSFGACKSALTIRANHVAICSLTKSDIAWALFTDDFGMKRMYIDFTAFTKAFSVTPCLVACPVACHFAVISRALRKARVRFTNHIFAILLTFLIARGLLEKKVDSDLLATKNLLY